MNPRLLGVLGLLAYVLGMHILVTVPLGTAHGQDLKAKMVLPPPPGAVGAAVKAEPSKPEDDNDFTDRVTVVRVPSWLEL